MVTFRRLTLVAVAGTMLLFSCRQQESSVESLKGRSPTQTGPIEIVALEDTYLKPADKPPRNVSEYNGKDGYQKNQLCFVSKGEVLTLTGLTNLGGYRDGHFKVNLVSSAPSTQREGLANTNQPCPMTAAFIFDGQWSGNVIDPKSKCCAFPLKTNPKFCELTGPDMGAFGASRSGRLHAACDIYSTPGTPVHAVSDGKIISAPYEFYDGTDALEVLHDEIVDGDGSLRKNVVVRYGEIAPGSAISPRTGKSFVAGERVTRGQYLAKVGILIGHDQHMVHFELYSGSGRGALTTYTGSYSRRSDLLNPTSFLKRWLGRKP